MLSCWCGAADCAACGGSTIPDWPVCIDCGIELDDDTVRLVDDGGEERRCKRCRLIEAERGTE